MSSKVADMYARQEVQGTKTLPAPHDSEYQKNFVYFGSPPTQTNLAPPHLPYQVPPLRTKPTSAYEDAPKSFPIQQQQQQTSNGKPAAKRKATEDDDVELSDNDDDESSSEDEKNGDEDTNNDDDEEGEETTDEDDEVQKAAQNLLLTQSKKAAAKGKKNGVLLAHRIAESKRASRPTDLHDISGSSNEADDDEEEDDDVEGDDDDGVTTKRKIMTPAEDLLGPAVMQKIKNCMKKNNAEFVDLDENSIWTLNALIVNLLMLKYPQMAMRLFCQTNDSHSSKTENLRRVAELNKFDPKKTDIPSGFLGTSYHALALASRFALPISAVVKPIGEKEAICAITLDPFCESSLKDFMIEATNQKLFAKSSVTPPVTMRRFALYNGRNIAMSKDSIQTVINNTAGKNVDPMYIDLHTTGPMFSTSTPTSNVEVVPVETTPNKDGRLQFVSDCWVDNQMVVRASDKNLIVNDVSRIIRESNVNMIVVPNDILAAMFRRRIFQRMGRVRLSPISYEDNPQSFCYYLKLATFPRCEQNDREINNYLAGPMFQQQRDFTFAHLLFGFIRMNMQYNDNEPSREKCVIDHMQIQSTSRLGIESFSAVHLAQNELPIRCLLRLNQIIVKLLTNLWKEYCIKLGAEHISKADFMTMHEKVSQTESVKNSVAFILDTNYEAQANVILREYNEINTKTGRKNFSDEIVVHEFLLFALSTIFPSL